MNTKRIWAVCERSRESAPGVYKAFETDCNAIVAQRAGVKVPAAKVVQKILDDVGKDATRYARQERQPKKERRSSTPQRAA